MDWGTGVDGVGVGPCAVEVRSLKLPDGDGTARRRRVTSCWDPGRPRFTRIPAQARLAREPGGLVGALITGRHGGFLKVGSLPGCQPDLRVPLGCLSKKALAGLLKNAELELFYDGGQVYAREKE